MMKVALVQMAAGQDKAANLHKALQMIQHAARAKADVIALPEMFLYRGFAPTVLREDRIAENDNGPSIKALKEAAQRHGIYLLAGSFLEKAKPPKAYNTSLVISPQGRVIGKYRKIHLFDARLGDKIIDESDFFIHGRKTQMVPILEWACGLSICFDVRFPEQYATYRQAGVNLIAVPSCFTALTGKAHWEILLRARAVENLSFVIAPNQVGQSSQGIKAYGNSMVVGPWGDVRVRASGTKEEIVYATISIKDVIAARQKLPYLNKGNV